MARPHTDIRADRDAAKDKYNRLRDELNTITRSMVERDLTAGEEERLERVKRGMDNATEEISNLRDEELDIVRSLAERGSTEAGTPFTPKPTRGRGPEVVTRHRQGAYDGITRAQTLDNIDRDELLRRSDSALEILRGRGVPDEGLARLAGMMEAPDEADLGALYPEAVRQRQHAAAQTLALSDPNYESAFQKVIRSPQHYLLDLTDDERFAMSRTRSFQRSLAGDAQDWRTQPMGDDVSRAALSLTSANGGFMVPFTLDPSLILTNSGAANPWRRWATIKQTSTNTWNGVNSSGVNAQWLGEAVTAADASPTVAQTTITPYKGAAWIFGSYEVLEDSDFGAQLPMLIGDAKDRLEEASFATGTGSGQPFGAVTRATATALAGGTITGASVYTLHQALPARYRNGRPAWFGNVTAQDLLRQTPTFTGSQVPLLQGNTMAPFGEPCYESTTVDGVISTGAHKVLLYGDGSQYLIVDRIGMSVLYEPIVKGAGSQLPSGQGGWFAYWRVGADSSVSGTSTALRVLSLT